MSQESNISHSHFRDNNEDKLFIIGAGLTGLTTAYLLKQRGVEASILEARDRIGGRIQTWSRTGEASIELGATWLGNKHQELITLLDKLGLGIQEQVLGETAIYEFLSTSPPQLVSLPPNSDPSYRILGGSSALTQALVDQLAPEQIQLGQAVKTITEKKGVFEIQTEKNTYRSDVIISTLPPNLLVNTVSITPNLPGELIDVANQTHTWMGTSIKVGFTFKNPFWREIKSSGTIFSNVGPVREMYDHSNAENTHFALKGFLNDSFYPTSQEERKTKVLNQLAKYYGDQVQTHISYVEKVWREDPFTFYPYHHSILPHHNNGHAIYQKAYLDGRFIVAGSETAKQFPGYMEGAIRSAQEVVDRILKRVK